MRLRCLLLQRLVNTDALTPQYVYNKINDNCDSIIAIASACAVLEDQFIPAPEMCDWSACHCTADSKIAMTSNCPISAKISPAWFRAQAGGMTSAAAVPMPRRRGNPA